MDLEDVSRYTLSDEDRGHLLRQQRECTFAWTTGEGRAAGVTMSYLWRDGAFWLASVRGRKRVTAMERRGEAAIVVSSSGTALGPGKAVTYQGRCQVLDDADTKAWFYAAMVDVMLGDNEAAKPAAVASMDTPNRVILRVEADRLLNNYDGAKLRAAMAGEE
jgi:nitroimidazol reductase NimA-like FMN-containing flavoprotein (pyridoxamine 5'-phosphate oxidase superfamily)